MPELVNHNGTAFIYDVETWSLLRKTHRIVCAGYSYCFNNVPSLPIQLLPEETVFVLNRNLIKVMQYDFDPSENKRELYKKFEQTILEQEQVCYKEIRRQKLETLIDKIVEGKRKNGDERTKEEIFNDELEKSCTITKENMIWPILLRPLGERNGKEVPKSEFLSKTTELKYRIYEDLWDRGYYISSGEKFGGDFLVYIGDPIAYHSVFIVRCLAEPDKKIHSTEIIAFGRLGTSVKKRAVLATVDKENKVSYITINWIDA